jgi:class 3 adenylate cyclase/TolB-like protein
MFTDMRGYSTLAQHNEVLALQLLEMKRSLADPLIAEHHGHLVKTIGDALMVEFRSALDAVSCATALQRQLHEHNESAAPEQRIVVRIGIHLGDVVRKDGDIFGDTVNIAARVEPQAPPGGVAVTRAVYEQVRTKSEYPLTQLGLYRLKGIDGESALFSVALPWLPDQEEGKRPVVEHPEGRYAKAKQAFARYTGMAILVVLLSIGAASYFHLRGTKTDVPAEIAVVVLPFEKLGSVDESMVIGLREAIEGTLSSLGNVHVISRSALPAGTRNEPLALQEIANATGATVALQGSVQREDEAAPYQLRADLVSIGDAEPLFNWSKEYGAGIDTDSLQRDVASRLAGPLRFLGSGHNWLADGFPATDNKQALQLLRRFLIVHYYGGDADRIGLIREALTLDPTFAQAHAYLAYYIALEAWADQGGGGLSDRKTISDEIAKAESLVPGLPEAQLARAQAHMLDSDAKAADQILTTVRESLAGGSEMHMLHGHVLRTLGRWRESLAEFEAVLVLDPYRISAAVNVAYIAYGLRNYENAEQTLRDIHEKWPAGSGPPRWKEEVEFVRGGNVERLAEAVNANFSEYHIDADKSFAVATRLAIKHFQESHLEVAESLKDFPLQCQFADVFDLVASRMYCPEPFAAESLALAGEPEKAASLAALHLPRYSNDAAVHPKEPAYAMRLALLQVFGGAVTEALATLQPLLERLEQPLEKWTEEDASLSMNAAIVLAWSGNKHQAVDLLAKSLDAPFGAHAAIVARDPVWRPLFGEAGFIALLAAHGQQLNNQH